MAHALDQAQRGAAADLDRVLPRGGQRRPGELREGAVLEAGDGQVARHVEADRAGRGQHAGRDLVVAAEHGRRRRAHRQQLARAAEAGVEVELAFQHQLRIDLHAVVAHRVHVAGITLDAGLVVALAPEEADAAVAQLDEVLGDGMGSAAVVHAHAVLHVARVVAGRDDADHRHAVRRQRLDQIALLRHRRRQHQPGQARAPHQGQQFLDGAVGRRAAGMDLQAVALLAAGGQHAVLQADQVMRVRVAVDQAQGEGMRAAQAARQRIGLVVQRGDGLAHALAHLGTHGRVLVDHAGHGLERHARGLGHIADRGARGRDGTGLAGGVDGLGRGVDGFGDLGGLAGPGRLDGPGCLDGLGRRGRGGLGLGRRLHSASPSRRPTR